MQFVVSWLVWPPALASVFALTYKSYKQKQFVTSLPLLASQVNTAFIWMCLSCASVGEFYHAISGQEILKGKFFGLRNDVIRILLGSAVQLEPLNLFLYIYRFLATLEKEAENKYLKLSYRWFARVTIFIIPLGFYAVFAAYVFNGAKYYELTLELKIKESNHYLPIVIKLTKTLGYLTLVCNLMCCVILALVLRLVSKVAN